MRYIRTKDGIFRYKLMSRNEYEFRVEAGNIIQGKEVEGEVKIADTVEELCDEFIVVHKDGTHVFQKSTAGDKVSKEYVEYLLRNNQTFYGAIWTDKGLIYVAKMNNKGELELL